MKILVIGRFYQEGFAQFLADELHLLGHDVVRYDPAPPMLPFGSRMTFYVNRLLSRGHSALAALMSGFGIRRNAQGLKRAIGRAGKIDLTLVSHDYLLPSEAAQVKLATKAPLVLWYPDPIWSFQRHMFLNGPYDFLFFKDPFIVDLLRRNLRSPAYYMPECFSPSSLCAGDTAPDPQISEYETDICTAGNLYAYRVAFFRNLTDRNVKIWGLPAPLWMHLGKVKPMVQNRFVAHAEKARAFRGAKIVLNNLNPSEIWGTNVRTFEICGAGGFQIVDWRPGLADLFVLEEEIVTFRDLPELNGKIDHYLNAPDERRKIAGAGQRRAIAEHTYAHRLRLILDTVDGRSSGHPLPSVGWSGT